MIGLLVTGHAHFATGIGSSLKLMTGIEEHVVLVDYEEDYSVDDLKEKINEALEQLSDCDGVLILSDLAGGLPYRCAVQCRQKRPNQNIEIVAGTNFPMLIEAGMMMAAYECPLELCEIVMAAGKDYIVRFTPEDYEEEVTEEGEENVTKKDEENVTKEDEENVTEENI